MSSASLDNLQKWKESNELVTVGIKHGSNEYLAMMGYKWGRGEG